MDRDKPGSARSRSRLPPLSFRKLPVAMSVSEWTTPSPGPRLPGIPEATNPGLGPRDIQRRPAGSMKAAPMGITGGALR